MAATITQIMITFIIGIVVIPINASNSPTVISLGLYGGHSGVLPIMNIFIINKNIAISVVM
jgi:hypothetical protein